MPGLTSFLFRWRGAVNKIGRVTDDQVVFFVRMKILNGGMVDFDFVTPWRLQYIFSGLCCVFMLEFDSVDLNFRRCALGYHQGNDPGSSTDVQNTVDIFSCYPSSQQDS